MIFMGKLTISVAMFNSELLVYQRVMVFGMGHRWMLLDDINDSWMAWMIWDIK